LNESSKFLAGKGSDGSLFSEKGYQHLGETHLPKQIASYLRSILCVTQPGSHRSEVDLYVKKMKTGFLFKSTLYQLFDVLIWFKMYVDSKPKTENWIKIATENKSTEVSKEFIMGKVININSLKGFAFFKPNTPGDNVIIPPYLVTNHSLIAEMPIRAEIEIYTDKRDNEI